MSGLGDEGYSDHGSNWQGEWAGVGCGGDSVY